MRTNAKEKLFKKIEIDSKYKRSFNFVIGCFLVAVAYNLFLEPNNIVAGGVSGLAIIVNELLEIPEALFILMGDIVLLFLSFIFLGVDKTRGAILGSLLLPVFILLTENIGAYIVIENNDLLLSTIFGAVLTGFGLGMMFKNGFNCGGTDIINQIMNKYMNISVGTSMLIVDGAIVLSSAFVFGFNRVLYAAIALYIISYISDRVILGVSDNKAFYIITEHDKEVKNYILKYLGHGVTIFNAYSGNSKDSRKVLMCVLPTSDYYRLKTGIIEIDPEAFFVVTDSYEVFGGE